MRTLSLVMFLTVDALAQPTGPIVLGGMSSSGPPGGVGMNFQLEADRREAADTPGRFGSVFRTRPGRENPFLFVSRCIYDNSRHVYFGYDILIEKQQSGAYLVTFGKLNLSAFELVTTLVSPPEGLHLPAPSTDWRNWTFEPLPSYPEPQTLQEDEKFRIDLLTDADTGRRLFDTFYIRPSSVRQVRQSSANRAAPPVSGNARDFSAADAELQIVQPLVTLNGSLLDANGPAAGIARGALAWLYLPNHGRYVLSLVPRVGFDFKKTGEVRGGVITFTLGEDSIKLQSMMPVAQGNAPYNLFVLHDGKWEPTAETQKGHVVVGTFAVDELSALKEK